MADVRLMVNGESLGARVAVLEGKVASLECFRKNFDVTLQREFRAQAELIDRLFILRFDEWDKRWDAKLAAQLEQLEQKLDRKLDQKLEAKLEPVRAELVTVHEGVRAILERLNL